MNPMKFDYKFILAGAVLLVAQSGVALAGERVIVDGPYTISQSDRDNVSISRAVSYSDLDLGNPSGVDALKNRVKETARDVCQQIDRRYPSSVSDNQECVRNAAANAMSKVRVIVASRANGTRVAALP